MIRASLILFYRWKKIHILIRLVSWAIKKLRELQNLGIEQPIYYIYGPMCNLMTMDNAITQVGADYTIKFPKPQCPVQVHQKFW